MRGWWRGGSFLSEVYHLLAIQRREMDRKGRDREIELEIVKM